MNQIKKEFYCGLFSVFLLLILFPISGFATQSHSAYLENEHNDYLNGLSHFQTNHQKTYKIYKQLVAYANMQFPVVYAQTYRWGIAQPGGLIILDVSTIEKPIEILAYKFAHEWAHEALGHVPNVFNPDVNLHKSTTLKNQEEDEADYYSGRFLYSYGYEIKSVVEYLKSLPLNSHNQEYSSTQVRASNVLRGYLDKRNGSQVLGLFQLRPCETELRNLKNSIYSMNGRAGFPGDYSSIGKSNAESLWQVAITLPVDCIGNNNVIFKDELLLNRITPYKNKNVSHRN